MFFTMKHLRITFFILIVSHSAGFSQVYDPYTYQDIEPKPTLSEKFFFGGGIGLQFGTFSVIRLTPEIGIRPKEMFEIGIGAYYLYSKSFYYNISVHVYGGNVF